MGDGCAGKVEKNDVFSTFLIVKSEVSEWSEVSEVSEVIFGSSIFMKLLYVIGGVLT